MGLIRCPECGAKISDVAKVCPRCGFSASEGNALVPLSLLVPVPHQTLLQIPGAEIFAQGGSFIPASENSKIVDFFKNADQMVKLAPSLYDAIQKLMEKRGTVWAADFSEAAEKLIANGELVLGVEKKTGKLLPQLREKATGLVYENARLKAVDLPNGVAASFATVQLQITMAELMAEIQSLAANVEALRLEAQGDRMARAKAVWLKLEQATHLRDPQLREAKILAIADAATEQRCILQENYGVQLALVAGKGNADSHGQAASTAINNLTVISLMARTEYAAYMLLDEEESAKAAFEQFQTFVIENKLDNRQTLVKLNGKSKQNLDPTISTIHGLTRHIATLKLELPANETRLLEEVEKEGENDDE